jgi:hypothetical protein
LRLFGRSYRRRLVAATASAAFATVLGLPLPLKPGERYEQVRVGGVDGHARIRGDHGYLFLCSIGRASTICCTCN